MKENEFSGRQWDIRSYSELKSDIYQMNKLLSDLIHGSAPPEIYESLPDVLLEFIYDQKMVAYEQLEEKLKTLREEDFVERELSFEEWKKKRELRMKMAKKTADKIDSILESRGELYTLFSMYRNKNKQKVKKGE